MDPQFRRLTYELYAAEQTGDLTKVAGPVSGLKRLVRRLLNSFFSQEARNFQTSNYELKSSLQKLYRSFKRLENAIDDYDLSTYKLALVDVKEQIGQLVELTGRLDNKISDVENKTNDAIESKVQTNPSAPAAEQPAGSDEPAVAPEARPVTPEDSTNQVTNTETSESAPASEEADGFVYPSKQDIIDNRKKRMSDVPFLRGNVTPKAGLITRFTKEIGPLLKSKERPDDDSRQILLDATQEMFKHPIFSMATTKLGKVELMVRFTMPSPLLIKPADLTAHLILQPGGDLTLTYIKPLNKMAAMNDELIKTAELNPEFWKAFADMCQRIGVRPEILIPTMLIESNLTPSAGSLASGLIQMMPDTLKDNGWKGSPKEFRQLSGTQQIPYIESYVKSHLGNVHGTFRSPTQYYLANFWPDAFNYASYFNKYRGTKDEHGVPFWPVNWEFHDPKAEDPQAVIVEQNPKFRKAPGWTLGYERASYKENGPVLDVSKDGIITYGDLEKVIEHQMSRTAYQQALGALRQAADYVPSTQPTQAPTGEAAAQPMAEKVDYKKKLEEEAQTLANAFFGNFDVKNVQDFVQKIEHMFDSVQAPEVAPLSATAGTVNAIEIFGYDEANNLEFAKTVSRHFNKIFTTGNEIKIKGTRYCVVFEPNVEHDRNQILDVCGEVAEELEHLTKNKVRYYLSTNKTSSYQPVDYDRVEKLSRAFRLNLLRK
jgi:hypothetical protein